MGGGGSRGGDRGRWALVSARRADIDGMWNIENGARYVRRSAQRCGVRWSRGADAALRRWCIAVNRDMGWLDWVGDVAWHRGDLIPIQAT